MLSKHITLEEFSPYHRTRVIGNSQYRICKEDFGEKMWYILETYSDTAKGWGIGRAYYTKSLKDVIAIINSFTKEGEILDLKRGRNDD